LLWAASRSSKSDLRLFKLLLESGAEILKPKKADGMTALHIAAASNDVHLVDLILANVDNKKLATNLKNLDGWTPTMLASFMNNFDSLNLLMESGADLTLRNGSGLSALDEIVRNDYKDLFECIYDKVKLLKRDLKSPGSFGYIHIAAGQEGTKCLQFLLEQGESCN